MIELLLTFDPALLAAFVLAGLILNVTPGADFMFVTASGIAGGPRVGMAAGMGTTLGIAVHVLAAAAGISALLIAHPAAYDAIRYLGAAYLVWLAIQTWRSAGDLQPSRASASPWRALRRGFVTNVLNPKTALFIFAFIPQFTDPALGPVWQQILLLGTIFLVNGAVFVLCLGFLAGSLARHLQRHATRLARLSALIFGGLALRIALD